MYDISKQPKWVQDEVAGLQRRLREADDRINRLRKLTKATTGYAGDMDWDRPVGVQVGLDDIRTYGQGIRVHFKQGRRRGYITVHQTDYDMNTLEIYSSTSMLSISPKAGNVVTITATEDQ